MSDYESRYEDAKRERYEEQQEAILPDPCGCEFLSECCGIAPGEASPDVSKDNLAGICGGCREHTAFEPSQEQTWVQTYSGIYGDDADGNQGALMRMFECTNCRAEKEVVYA